MSSPKWQTVNGSRYPTEYSLSECAALEDAGGFRSGRKCPVGGQLEEAWSDGEWSDEMYGRCSEAEKCTIKHVPRGGVDDSSWRDKSSREHWIEANGLFRSGNYQLSAVAYSLALYKIQAHEPLFKELIELRGSTQDAEDILEEKEEELTECQDELAECQAIYQKEVARADALEKELHQAKKMNAIHVRELNERTEKLVEMTLEQDALKEQVETMSQQLQDLVDLTGADDDADIYPSIQVLKSELYRDLEEEQSGGDACM
jgi:hypothetical protein